mgnify:CR=1 FL=1
MINKLKWLIYHQTEQYVMDEIHYNDLNYSVYYLHRKDKFFGFTIHRNIDRATSLYPSNLKPLRWIYDYTYLKTNKIIVK